MKPLDIDHARDGEVMLAFQMNGEQLPLLNGFPMRLIVPGWYSDYWVKMLSDIEVLDAPDQNYLEAVGYRVPDTPHASVKPGETGFKTVPITRMVPRSFFTNVTNDTIVKPGAAVPVRGIAFGGDCGVSQVELSADGGHSWQKTELGPRRGHVQLSPMEYADNSAPIRNADSAGALYQYEGRGPAGRAELERRRLYAQRDRARSAQGGLIYKQRKSMAISANAIARGAVTAVGLILLAIATPARWVAQPALAADAPPVAPAPSIVTGGGVTLAFG